jgi:hypothetical protein
MLDSVLITVMYQFEGAPMLSLPSTVSFTVSGQTPPHAPYSCRLQHMGGAHTNYHHRKLLSPSTFVSFSFLLNPDRIRAGWGGQGAISDAVGSEESSPASRSLGGGGRRDARTSQRDATSGERRVESAATPWTQRVWAARRVQPQGSGEAREDPGEPRPRGSGRPSDLPAREKVYFTPTYWVGTNHPQPMKMDFYPLNFLKRDKLPREAVLKNHIESQKNH